MLPPHIDAALAAIRIAGKDLAKKRHRNDIEQARFNLYKTLERDDLDDAEAWLRVLRVLMKSLPDDALELLEPAVLDLADYIEGGE